MDPWIVKLLTAVIILVTLAVMMREIRLMIETVRPMQPTIHVVCQDRKEKDSSPVGNPMPTTAPARPQEPRTVNLPAPAKPAPPPPPPPTRLTPPPLPKPAPRPKRSARNPSPRSHALIQQILKEEQLKTEAEVNQEKEEEQRTMERNAFRRRLQRELDEEQRPAQIVRQEGDVLCYHTWSVKARNQHGFNLLCTRCQRHIYQAWSTAELRLPQDQRRLRIQGPDVLGR